MKRFKHIFVCMLLIACGWSTNAYATVSCSWQNPSFTISFNNTANVIAYESILVTCTRTGASLGAITALVKIFNTGGTGGACNGTNFTYAQGCHEYKSSPPGAAVYSVWSTSNNFSSTCSTTTPWVSTAGSATALTSTTVSWAANDTSTKQVTIPFYVCVPKSLSQSFPADNSPLTATLTTTGTVTITGSAETGSGGPNPTTAATDYINGTASCTASTAPDILITYLALQNGTQSGSTQVGITCSSIYTYTISVSPASDSAAGIAYDVTPDVTSQRATGAEILHTITATAGANQVGSCATTCGATETASKPHTVTFTY